MIRTITFPDLGFSTSRVGFGTASLHHAFTTRGRQGLLGEAWDAGIRYFDTAPLYGHEMAERELGRFLARRRSDVILATKVGIAPDALLAAFPPALYARIAVGAAARKGGLRRGAKPLPRDYTPAYVEARVLRSLRLLQTDYVDVLYLHEPALRDIVDGDLLLETIDRLRSAGRVRHVGLSGGGSECMAIAARYPGLAQVLQIDSLPETGGVAAIAQGGRTPHVTFGHFRRTSAGGTPTSAAACLRAAVRENPDGVILFASRSGDRVRETVQQVAEADRQRGD